MTVTHGALLAKFIRSSVHSRICATLPGVPGSSSLKRVWMESTTRNSGLNFRACSSSAVSDVSQSSRTAEPPTPSRMARSLICSALSSPEA